MSRAHGKRPAAFERRCAPLELSWSTRAPRRSRCDAYHHRLLRLPATLPGVALALGIGLAAPTVVTAQESNGEPAVTARDSTRLPVSLDRIKRRLASQEAEEGRRSLLNLNFYVDVYARAPALDILQGINPESESVSYGAPTHSEMLEAVTPREWRPRAISTGNLFGWR